MLSQHRCYYIQSARFYYIVCLLFIRSIDNDLTIFIANISKLKRLQAFKAFRYYRHDFPLLELFLLYFLDFVSFLRMSAIYVKNQNINAFTRESLIKQTKWIYWSGVIILSTIWLCLWKVFVGFTSILILQLLAPCIDRPNMDRLLQKIRAILVFGTSRAKGMTTNNCTRKWFIHSFAEGKNAKLTAHTFVPLVSQFSSPKEQPIYCSFIVLSTLYVFFFRFSACDFQRHAAFIERLSVLR